MDARDPHTTLGLPLAALAFASALVFLFLIDVVARTSTAPPAALGADAPREVFAESRARAVHARVFAGSTPHPLGSAEHAAVRERLLEELRALGCEPLVEEGVTARNGVVARVQNVIVPPARRSQGEALLLCAHYDSVAAGPGASDDGAGVAALLEVLRALRAQPPDTARPLILLFDDGEELGLLGAQAFVESSAYAADVGVVVNLEARGTCGASRMFETSEGNARLIELLADALPHPSATSVSQEIYRRMPNDTDLTVFKKRGWPGLNFAFVGGGRRYHTQLDDLAHLERDTLQHHGENALAITRRILAEHGSFASRGADATYCDVLGRTLVVWPASLSPLFAALAFALLALALRRALRRGLASAREVLQGAGIALLAPLCAALLAFPADRFIAATRTGVYPWPPDSASARAFVVSIAIAGALLVHALVARAPSRALSQTLGGWLVHAFLGVLVSLWIPGATYLFLLGAAAAALGAWALRAPGSVNIVAVAASACVWCPFLAGIEDVFELRTLQVPAVLGIAGGWALLATPFTSTFSDWSRRARFSAAGVFAFLALVALAATLAEPSQTPEQPQPVRFVHVQRAGESGSTLYANGFGSEGFTAWSSAQGFARELAPIPGWLGRFGALSAKPVAALELPAPELAWIERAPASEGFERGLLRVRSQRAARQLVVVVRPGTQFESLRWRARDWPLRGAGGGRLIAAGFGDEPIELSLRMPVAAKDGAERPDDAFELLDIDTATSGPLFELVRALPAGFLPRSEGAVTIVSRSGSL